MTTKFPNCWEIKNCGRQKDGAKVAELGECIASKEKMGHSCWAVAGTLCGGTVQGTHAQKLFTCMTCNVFMDYNRTAGRRGKEISLAFPEEDKELVRVLHDIRQSQSKAKAKAKAKPVLG